MIYLTEADILIVAEVVVGEVLVRDHGLISAAVGRPASSAFGEDAYLDLDTKAAALLQSLARNHPFVDGNKRVSWAATGAFLWMNGWRLTLTNDEAYDLVIAVATGALDDVSEIGAVLRAGSEPR